MSREPPPLGVGDPVPAVLSRLEWMEAEQIWPNGLRYLWTDAFGVSLLVSLAEELDDERLLDRAARVVDEVDRVLGRMHGYRIGEAPDRGGQYFHYLTVWAFALGALGRHRSDYRERAIDLVRDVHPRFVVPEHGVWWKMTEDLSGPAPGVGLGGLDPFQAYAVYAVLDAGSGALAQPLADMAALIDKTWRRLHVTQDLGLGMMLWSAAHVPRLDWARSQRDRSLTQLDAMWIDPPGYFCREPDLPHVRFAFTNAGVALGLQSVGAHRERVEALIRYFDRYRSGDDYDREAITHVMSCVARFPGVMLPSAAGAGPVEGSG